MEEKVRRLIRPSFLLPLQGLGSFGDRRAHHSVFLARVFYFLADRKRRISTCKRVDGNSEMATEITNNLTPK